jgi:hypothetical protein
MKSLMIGACDKICFYLMQRSVLRFQKHDMEAGNKQRVKAKGQSKGSNRTFAQFANHAMNAIPIINRIGVVSDGTNSAAYFNLAVPQSRDTQIWGPGIAHGRKRDALVEGR